MLVVVGGSESWWVVLAGSSISSYEFKEHIVGEFIVHS